MLKPLSTDRWNYETAAHLLNRAGFGGPPAEIEKLADLGHDAAVSSLLDYEKIPDPTPDPGWAKPDPDGVKQLRDAAKNATPEERRKLQQAGTARPVSAHDGTARLVAATAWPRGRGRFRKKWCCSGTAILPPALKRCATPITCGGKTNCSAGWPRATGCELLIEAGKDPAMLIWLDQAQSRKEHPNENFAREVMELFSLGEGHYTEKDVTEGARALTGWSLDRLKQKLCLPPVLSRQRRQDLSGPAPAISTATM